MSSSRAEALEADLRHALALAQALVGSDPLTLTVELPHRRPVTLVGGARAAATDGTAAALELCGTSGSALGRLRVVGRGAGSLPAATTAGLTALCSWAAATADRWAALVEAERDAEERRFTEALVENMEGRLEFAESVLEMVAVGVIATNARGELTLMNQVARRWQGIGPVEGLRPEDYARAYHLYEADGVTPLSPARVPLLQALEHGAVDDVEIVIAPPGLPAVSVVCSGRSLSRDAVVPLGAFVVMTDVTHQRQLEAQLRALAQHDPLTKLANRTLLLDELAEALESGPDGGSRVGVFFCDMDGFKAVNDEFGHAVGDEVIVEVGRRLAACSRPGDTVGRLGGDEFIMICPGLGTPEAAEAVLRRVREVVAVPMSLRGVSYTPRVSVGYTLSETGTTAARLLEEADAQMYRIKRSRSAVQPLVRSGRRQRS